MSDLKKQIADMLPKISYDSAGFILIEVLEAIEKINLNLAGNILDVIYEALLSDEVVEEVAGKLVEEWTYFPPTLEEWDSLIKAALTAAVARIKGEG